MAKYWIGAAFAVSLLSACSAQTETAQDTQNGAESAEAVKSAETDAAEAPLASVIMDKTEGCMEGPAAQFGRYIGDWTMSSQSLSRQDGKTWNENPDARWNFTCVGNGVAVQDFWMPGNGGNGTNLRIYDPETKRWDIAWTANGSPGFSHISAKQNEDGHIIMEYVDPIPNPLRRITFFTPDDTGWDWHMAMSTDGGKNWLTVVKMRATKR